jgi:hypothetical protein
MALFTRCNLRATKVGIIELAMTNNDDRPLNPPFHFDIWKGHQTEFGCEDKAIYYVENHNAPCSYKELATDFHMAAIEILKLYRESQLANWMGPMAHLVRQTIELNLKSMIEAIAAKEKKFGISELSGHNLKSMWDISNKWLDSNHFPAIQDERRQKAEYLVMAFHAIDPRGDLFRFAVSRQSAFGKQKSYDRVGIIIDRFEDEFTACVGYLSHWEAVVFWKHVIEAEGFSGSPAFDPDGFPKIK